MGALREFLRGRAGAVNALALILVFAPYLLLAAVIVGAILGKPTVSTRSPASRLEAPAHALELARQGNRKELYRATERLYGRKQVQADLHRMGFFSWKVRQLEKSRELSLAKGNPEAGRRKLASLAAAAEAARKKRHSDPEAAESFEEAVAEILFLDPASELGLRFARELRERR